MSNASAIQKVVKSQGDVQTSNGTLRIVLDDNASKLIYAMYEGESDRVVANAGER